MRGLGILDESWGLSARDPQVPAWDRLSEQKQDEFDLRMSIYAAQVSAMDRGVGRIVECLRANGILANTLVLFMSDNGGCHEEIHRKDVTPALFGTNDSFESYGRPWANMSNAPFREFKSWVHEGGISTPLIAHWPGGIGRSGTIERQVGHFSDIMPTCLELAGAAYPTDDPALHPLVGQSLAPALRGTMAERPRIFWEHEGNRALRDRTWKLVAKSVDGPWELYDMAEDRTEQRDLAGEDPRRVQEMSKQWHDIAEKTDVLPLDGRDWGSRLRNPRGQVNGQ
jgi:arylsulfatase